MDGDYDGDCNKKGMNRIDLGGARGDDFGLKRVMDHSMNPEEKVCSGID